MKVHTATLAFLLIGGLSGCMTQAARDNDPRYAPTPPIIQAPTPIENGAIYQSSQALSLFEDDRARRVGDLLTINLIEQTNGKSTAKTKTSKSTDVDISNPTLLGAAVEFQTPKFFPLASHTANNLSERIQSSSSFDGSGNSDQSNSLSGTITVTVSRVLANGYLVIKGEKWVNINQSREYIRLSGIIRPLDIRSDNTVDSTRVANARIEYGGSSTISESNQTGWLARFFTGALSGMWPF